MQKIITYQVHYGQITLYFDFNVDKLTLWQAIKLRVIGSKKYETRIRACIEETFRQQALKDQAEIAIREGLVQ